MGWIALPESPGSLVEYWPNLRQFDYAIAERAKAAGQCFWPPPNHAWVEGVAGSVTETTMTVASSMPSLPWCGGSDDTSGNVCPPWTCTPCPEEGWLGSSFTYYLVFDNGTYEQQVKTQIDSWTDEGVFTFNNIRDFVTAGVIPSVASLEDRFFGVISQENNAMWTADRILEWPNDYEWARGVIASSTVTVGMTTTTYPNATTIHDPNKSWVVNEHVGRDILVYGTDGFLKRFIITANDETTATYATQSILPEVSSNYIILTHNARGWPNRGPSYARQWYRGYHGDGWSSHRPTNDDTDGVTWGSQTVGVPNVIDDEGDCGLLPELAWDNDYNTGTNAELLDPISNPCGTPYDTYYAPDIFKTIRGLQLAVEQLSDSYCDASVSCGNITPPTWNPAIMFNAAGINSFTGMTGSVVGVGDGGSNNQINVSLSSVPYVLPQQVWFSITHSDGSRNAGRGVLSYSSGEYILTGTNISDTFYTEQCSFSQSGGSVTIPDNGRSIIISLGWSAFMPREFKRMFANDGVFIPDVASGPPPTAIDPGAPEEWDSMLKSCFGCGKYYKLGASTAYIDRRQVTTDYSQPQGYAVEDTTNSWNSFQEGDLARYSGDDWNDPSTQAGLNSFLSTNSGVDPVATYWDRFFAGQLSPANQFKKNKSRGGTTAIGDTFFLRDISQNWFNFQWFGGAAMRIESGTSTSGSTTSLTDSSKVDSSYPGSETVESHCYWEAARFVGFSGPYVGFTVEILISGSGFTDPNAVIEKRLITSSNSSAVTVSWSEPLTISAAGLQYRIQEPYQLNRWKGRTLTLIDPSGTMHTTTITGNSDDTIFFTPIVGVTVGSGFPDSDGNQLPWTYIVRDPLTGTIWKWSGSSWVKPTGADTARNGVPTTGPADFLAAQNGNLPTYVRRYGKAVIGDYFGEHLLNELQAAIQTLKYTMATGDFVANSSDADISPAYNSVSAFTGPFALSGTSVCGTFTDRWECIGAGGGVCNQTTLTPSVKTYLEEQWALSGNQSVSAGYPNSISVFQGNQPDGSGPTGNASALACYYEITVSACPVNPLTHTTTYWNYAGIDSSDTPPTTANCSTVNDYTFSVPSGVDAAYHEWVQWGSSGGSGGDEYSPLLGSVTIPADPALTPCPDITFEGSDCATCCQYTYLGISGYCILNAVAILTWEFTYA